MSANALDNLSVLAGRRVLVTGHTGFKGSWLVVWLEQLGARVSGFSLQPPTEPSNFAVSRVEGLLERHFIGDIRDRAALASAVREAEPEVILHLAAQPIVREGYADPVGTFETNVMGTVNLLEAVRLAGRPCAVVVVSSDKCYDNREHVWGYRECDALGGYDPYSASKGGTEIVTASYRSSYFNPATHAEHGVSLASARAGNVLGGGDWASARIMTDIVAALRAGEPVRLRNPAAVRPWQHVLEPLSGYLALAARLLADPAGPACSAWNFGPLNESTVPVRDVTELAIQAWGEGRWEDVSSSANPHEAGILRLSIDKAAAELGWTPRWGIAECVTRTVSWYRSFYLDNDNDMLARCRADIAAYSAAG